MSSDDLTKIKNFAYSEMDRSKDPVHDIQHLERIRKNTLKIVKTLNIKNIDLNLLESICYLHDLTYTEYKPGFKTYILESKYIVKILKQKLPEFELPDAEVNIILDSVRRHTHSFPLKRLNSKSSNLYAKILQDADTLDMFSNERYVAIRNNKSDNLFQRLISLMSDWGFSFGKRNLGFFLDYPQLAIYFYVQKDTIWK